MNASTFLDVGWSINFIRKSGRHVYLKANRAIFNAIIINTNYHCAYHRLHICCRVSSTPADRLLHEVAHFMVTNDRVVWNITIGCLAIASSNSDGESRGAVHIHSHVLRSPPGFQIGNRVV